MSKGDIHFRTDGELARKLDRAVVKLRKTLEGEGIRATRSTVARYLLSQALGESIDTAVMREALKHMHLVVHRAANRALHDLIEQLPEYIEEELEQ
jgi:hypothetical protein